MRLSIILPIHPPHYGGSLWGARRMVSAAGRTRDVVRDLFSSALHACLIGQQWQRAVYLHTSFCRRGLKPTARMFTHCIGACVTAGQWQIALRLLQGMWSAALAPNGYTYAKVVTALRLGKQVPLAIDFFDSAVLVGAANLPTYAAGLAAHAEMENWEEVLVLLRQMRLKHMHQAGATYRACIDACLRPELWQTALSLLSEMQSVDLDPHVGALPKEVFAFSSSPSGWLQAISLFQELVCRELGRESPDFPAALKACANGGHWQAAVHVLQSMDEALVPLDATTAVDAAAACSQHWRLVVDIVDRAKEHDDSLFGSARLLTLGLQACGEAGRWQGALQMLREAQANPGMELQAVHYHAASYAARGCLTWEQALRLTMETLPLHRRRLEDGILEDQDLPPVASLSITLADDYRRALALCRRGRLWRGALDLLEGIGHDGLQRGDYVLLPFRAQRQGRWDQVLAIMEQLQPRREAAGESTAAERRALARRVSAAAFACLHRGAPEEGLRLLDGLPQDCAEDPKHAARTLAWEVSAARACEEAAAPELAVKLLAKLLRRLFAQPRARLLSCSTAVLAMDVLEQHAALDARAARAFGAAVSAPLLPLLRRWSSEAALQRPSLPGRFAREALEALGVEPGGEGWAAAAAHNERRARFMQHAPAYGNPPEAEVVAWVAFAVAERGAVHESAGCPVGRAHPALLSRMQARLPSATPRARDHAERGALVVLLHRLRDFEAARGGLQLYVGRRPCVSCLVVACRARHLLPGVRLRLSFGDWHESRRWTGIDSSGVGHRHRHRHRHHRRD
ncbi:unnamed protein product [Prorocentrum cordatum]|uniref:Pentatricopeptide repeat-containing protein, chloroplastic n=1 Tax=Prorocentrum cordatum TaxID=2364126 RepID=A0ABN9VI97_9DINO|nr:unnamed protein product [Polarella glacialis]